MVGTYACILRTGVHSAEEHNITRHSSEEKIYLEFLAPAAPSTHHDATAHSGNEMASTSCSVCTYRLASLFACVSQSHGPASPVRPHSQLSLSACVRCADFTAHRRMQPCGHQAQEPEHGMEPSAMHGLRNLSNSDGETFVRWRLFSCQTCVPDASATPMHA